MIHAVIHIGTHGHPIVNGRCRKVIQQIKLLVEEEVFCTPLATMLVIVLATSKTFIFEHWLNKDGDDPIELLQGNKFTHVMDKLTTSCFPNIKNLVTSFKHHLINKMYVSSIFGSEIYKWLRIHLG